MTTTAIAAIAQRIEQAKKENNLERVKILERIAANMKMRREGREAQIRFKILDLIKILNDW